MRSLLLLREMARYGAVRKLCAERERERKRNKVNPLSDGVVYSERRDCSGRMRKGIREITSKNVYLLWHSDFNQYFGEKCNYQRRPSLVVSFEIALEAKKLSSKLISRLNDTSKPLRTRLLKAATYESVSKRRVHQRTRRAKIPEIA